MDRLQVSSGRSANDPMPPACELAEMGTTGDTIPCLRLRSEDLTPEGAFNMWRATLPHYSISLPDDMSPASFSMDTSVWLLDPLVLTAGFTSRANLVRSPPDPFDGYDNFVFVVFLEGSWQGEAGGQPFRLGAGEMIVFDASRSIGGPAEDCRYVMVNAPRRTVQEMVPNLSHLHGRIFRSASGRLLNEHLRALARYLPRMQKAEVSRATRATLSLLAAGLAEFSDEENVSEEALISPAIRQRVERHIEQNLSRTDLTPGALSEELGIARSTLYRAFTPLGGVSAHILERRLETARSILFHPEDHRPINEIADILGFENAATFSKAFARRFGCSPRKARSSGTTHMRMSGRALFDFWRNVLMARENPQGGETKAIRLGTGRSKANG